MKAQLKAMNSRMNHEERSKCSGRQNNGNYTIKIADNYPIKITDRKSNKKKRKKERKKYKKPMG